MKGSTAGKMNNASGAQSEDTLTISQSFFERLNGHKMKSSEMSKKRKTFCLYSKHWSASILPQNTVKMILNVLRLMKHFCDFFTGRAPFYFFKK